MRIANDEILDSSEDLSLNFETLGIWLGYVQNYAIQLIFDGSPNGTFTLEASNDQGQPNSGTEILRADITNWTHVTDSDQSVNSSGNHMWVVENVGYRWVRVKWEASGGSTGNLTSVRFNTKGY